MKKYNILIILFTALFCSQLSFAAPAGKKTETNLTEQQQARLNQLEIRVLEIKKMDKSHLNASERKALRKELYQIKSEMKGFTSGGVYLSVAAIVIIILVLILIL